MKIKNKNEKGISIILSTIIIISICIAIAIAAALWTSGIAEKFMHIEKIEIIDAWSKKGRINDREYWFISIDFRNTGGTNVEICNIMINGKPFKDFVNDTRVLLGSVREGWFLDPSNEETFIYVKPGEIGGIGIGFPSYAAHAGQKMHIVIYTVNGKEYHISLILEE